MKNIKYYFIISYFLTGIQLLFSQNNNPPYILTIISSEYRELWIGQIDSSIITFEVRDSLGQPISGKVGVKFSLINATNEYLTPNIDTTNEKGRIQTVIHTGSSSKVVFVVASIENTIIKSPPVQITIYNKPTQVLDKRNYLLNDFLLYQNYPNPFNPATTISYSVPTRSNVTLEVLNILGERVALLDEGEKNVGLYTVTWNANVSSSVYYFRLNTIKGSFVRKILLLK